MTINKIFATRMKLLVAGRSFKAFGDICGIDGKTVKSACDGIVPGHAILEKIAVATNKTHEWLFGHGPGDETVLQTSEPVPNSRKPNKNDQLVWKFQHIFDYLADMYDGDPLGVNDFIQGLEKDLAERDPDYRKWKYMKLEAIRESKKKRTSEDHQNGPLERKSVNGEE